MIALNIDGESLVNKAMEIRIRNKFQLIELIRSVIFTIDVDIELAKEQIIQAYELTQESYCQMWCMSKVSSGGFPV